MTTVLDLYKEADAKSLQMEGRVDELDRALSKMRDVFMDSKGESINAELRPLDNERIMAVKGLKKFLQSESYRTDLVKKNQAMQLLKSYGQCYQAGIQCGLHAWVLHQHGFGESAYLGNLRARELTADNHVPEGPVILARRPGLEDHQVLFRALLAVHRNSPLVHAMSQ